MKTISIPFVEFQQDLEQEWLRGKEIGGNIAIECVGDFLESGLNLQDFTKMKFGTEIPFFWENFVKRNVYHFEDRA